MRVDPKRNRVPFWQLALYATAAAASGVTHPIRKMWHAQNAIDRYALCHLTSAAGDTLLAIALADSVFFSMPDVGEAKLRVVAYLAFTMLPLAVAGPLLVVPLDRAGPRRLISFLAAVVRAAIAFIVAGQLDTIALYPAAFAILVAARVHGITKNGLTMAYAEPGEGLMRANARLGRVAVAGALTAAPLGGGAVALWGSGGAMVLAGVVYSACALVTLRLPHPRLKTPPKPIGRRGRLPVLTGPAIGAAGMRAATGFVLFLTAFATREGFPKTSFAAMAIAAAAGGFLADVLAPRLPETLREEFIVVGCTVAAGLGALFAFSVFSLPVLTIFAIAAGAATELGRLAFQSLMQANAPEGALGRVFVRYEVMFQISWVAGAAGPALLAIDFKAGILIMAGFYLALAGAWAYRFFRGGREPVGASADVP